MKYLGPFYNPWPPLQKNFQQKDREMHQPVFTSPAQTCAIVHVYEQEKKINYTSNLQLHSINDSFGSHSIHKIQLYIF